MLSPPRNRSAWIGEVFDGFEVQYVPRLDNHDTDHLTWIASSRAPTPLDAISEKLSKPSVKSAKSSSEEIRCWGCGPEHKRGRKGWST
jgi:hypothetical protein